MEELNFMSTTKKNVFLTMVESTDNTDNKVGCVFKIEESERNFKWFSVTNIYNAEIKSIELVMSTLNHQPNNKL